MPRNRSEKIPAIEWETSVDKLFEYVIAVKEGRKLGFVGAGLMGDLTPEQCDADDRISRTQGFLARRERDALGKLTDSLPYNDAQNARADLIVASFPKVAKFLELRSRNRKVFIAYRDHGGPAPDFVEQDETWLGIGSPTRDALNLVPVGLRLLSNAYAAAMRK